MINEIHLQDHFLWICLKTKTNALRGRYSRFFSASDVDTGNNSIYWPEHKLNTGYTLLYVPPAGAATNWWTKTDLKYIM